ncbi:MAG: HAMP domain-containing histidine kinase [Desulfuromonadales bacterium]|nr:HAMP domain-containing histidine kinase [Desulfuromonadales bacterium]
MPKMNDEELIAALLERFDANRRAINDLQELTEKLEATNRRLQDSEALKGHFLSNIRNEINNPLAAIMGFAYQLMGGDCSAEQTANNGRMIYDEAFELHFQLENVFAAAGLEAGQETPAPEHIDVAAILIEVLERLEHRCSEKEIELRHGIFDSVPFIGDPRFMQIILRNLVANALEFSPKGGIVTIALCTDDSMLRIAIRDHGPGIDSINHDRVFDRFWQLDWGRSKSHRGLGLGLSICRALAELSGGTICVESTIGAGCMFTLNIPLPIGEAATVAPEWNQLSDTVERY